MDIIVLKPEATEDEIAQVLRRLEQKGFKTTISKGAERTIIGVIGDTSKITEEEEESFKVMPGVENVMRILKPFKLASRDFKKTPTLIEIKGNVIGGKKIHVMAGPCSVENREMILHLAQRVKEAGATFLRGGAYKPRTSPYSFQGLGEEGLIYLKEASEKTDRKSVV